MTHAELLRRDAELAIREGGMYYSGEYLSRMAAVAESLEAENAKLRELVRDYERCTMHANCSRCEYDGKLSTHCPFSPCFPDADELRELGVEVDE